MVNLDVAELRAKIDLEGKYVEFNLLRTTLSAATLVKDLGVSLSDSTKEGECRGKCPKCGKERSFSFSVNTNRFNCFAKGCALKGGGAIDFFARLFDVSAKEASHLLACAYGIQPYAQEDAPMEPSREVALPSTETMPETMPESSPSVSPDTRQSAQYLIASIKHDLAQLEELLISR